MLCACWNVQVFHLGLAYPYRVGREKETGYDYDRGGREKGSDLSCDDTEKVIVCGRGDCTLIES